MATCQGDGDLSVDGHYLIITGKIRKKHKKLDRKFEKLAS